MWVHTCNPLLKVYNSNSHGLSLSDPTGHFPTNGTINAFVDDIKLFSSDHSTNSKTLTLVRATQDTQLWSHTLWSSGGSINYLKSHITPIIWKFNEHGHPELDINFPFSPRIKDMASASKIAFKTSSALSHLQYLGVWKSGDLSADEQIRVLV